MVQGFSPLRTKVSQSRNLRATLLAGYDYSIYLGATRRDRTWRAGARVAYNVMRNVELTLDYDFSRQFSNDSAGIFTRNSAFVGMTYRY